MSHRYRWISGLLAVAMLMLSGCFSPRKAPGADAESGVSAPSAALSTVGPTSGTTDPVYTAADGRPPLEDALKELYSQADSRYQTMAYLIVDTDGGTLETDFGSYRRVADDRFCSLEELRTFLRACFTDRIVDTLLPAGSAVWIERDGALYVLDSGKSANPLYAGHVFRLTGRDDSHIRLSCTRYYAKTPADVPEEPFFVPPADAVLFDTDNVNFELVRTGDGWRFDVFSLLY